MLPYIFHLLQGFPGNLARGLGKDAALNNVLQMLDEQYGNVMMFDTRSKKLCTLKQGSNKNIAEFGVHLSQQVQICQLEYLGKIQPKHVEEMKCNCFYEGRNPKYQEMLAHEVDDCRTIVQQNPAGLIINPDLGYVFSSGVASYSNLHLATQKLKRWAEVTDPLPPKMAATNGLNMMHSQMPGNLFPLHKLKGNCNFTT